MSFLECFHTWHKTNLNNMLNCQIYHKCYCDHFLNAEVKQMQQKYAFKIAIK